MKVMSKVVAVVFFISCATMVYGDPTELNILDQQAKYVAVDDTPSENERGEVGFGEGLYVPQHRYRFTAPMPQRPLFSYYGADAARVLSAAPVKSPSFVGGPCLKRKKNSLHLYAFYKMRIRRQLDAQYAVLHRNGGTAVQAPSYKVALYSCRKRRNGVYTLSYQVVSKRQDPYSKVVHTHKELRTMNIYDEEDGRNMERYLRWLQSRARK